MYGIFHNFFAFFKYLVIATQTIHYLLAIYIITQKKMMKAYLFAALIVSASFIFVNSSSLFPPYAPILCTQVGKDFGPKAARISCEQIDMKCIGAFQNFTFYSRAGPLLDLSNEALFECQSLYITQCEELCGEGESKCLERFPNLIDPEVLCEVFVDTYVAYDQMCSGVCEWAFLEAVNGK
eukprot:TRINITY_DN527_c0_g1_i4.p2 TRINITY_DN527_c0_g1~~TRINITY_DN527_c0_g1_i4.p2  ORF type:complete len:181 (-),score=6.91 TRINITY_DN527_c0_g1_i4:997-1539(-)